MANKTMKTLTIGSNTYEVVDESARIDIETLKGVIVTPDTTLSVSGAAADAKAVGDKISDIETQMKHVESAKSATKLETARTIGISEGVIGTPTSFNGENNIQIPVTSIKEAYLQWGGKSIQNGMSPIDAAMGSEFGANRLAYMPTNDITIEYSNDGGATWNDYEATDAQKCSLVTLNGAFYIGKKTDSITINDQLRISITATGYTMYFYLRKIMLYITTMGASECKVLIESCKNTDTFTFREVGLYDIDGRSGWNSIPYNIVFGGLDTNANAIRTIRMTFSIGGLSTNTTSSNALCIAKVRMYGETDWMQASNRNLAKTGHMYAYDANQNVTFPATVKATSFVGNATSATQDANGNVITSTYATKSELAALNNLVGDTDVNTQINNAIVNKADIPHSHTLADLDIIYSETEPEGVAGRGWLKPI